MNSLKSWLALAICLIVVLEARGDGQDRLKVGIQPDGRIVVPTNQILSPAGRQITFPGRPVDIAPLNNGKTLVAKNMKGLVFIDAATGKVVQTLASPVGFSAVGILVQGDKVFVSDAEDHVRVAERSAKGNYSWMQPIALKKPTQPKSKSAANSSGRGVSGFAYPTGLATAKDGELIVAANRLNALQCFDIATGRLTDEVNVGVAPFAILSVSPDLLFVSNWGGDLAKPGQPSAQSSGTPVRIDPRTSVANQGTVSVLARSNGRWSSTGSIRVGLHPCGMALSSDKRFLFVANASSDTVSVIQVDNREVIETISCRPEARLPFGSGTNALAVSPDGSTLFAANGTNNCIAVVRLGQKCSAAPASPAASQVIGQIPTGWYPGGLSLSADGRTLCVANIKGIGTVADARAPEQGRASRDHLGSISIIPIPDAAALDRFTAAVNLNNRLAYSLTGLEKPRPDAKPVPVPERHGEPSVIEHVIYVIKENRTYDQVFGDLKEGNGDPNLVMFGEKVTPNHHALVRQFTLFDNFYCSGVNSADGHQWCNEAYVTDYLERMFGKFTRSYPYEGSDPLAFAPTGFLWDNALAKKRQFFNYGEFTRTKYDRPIKWADLYAEYKNGSRKIKIDVTPNIDSLKPYTRAGYPGFVLTTPDVYRAQMFIADLKEYEKKGTFPNLTYLYLPCDHTSGTRAGVPTPRAMVADNDLALGRVVEAMSKSKFWPKTCFFVVEDDPQNGFDHVDGHRTVGLVISPYTRRKFVDSTCYNQTGMVKTMELILGLPPMNQLDLSATAMRACFSDVPDLTPFESVPNRIPLDEMNPSSAALKGTALYWAKKSEALDLSEADLADEDTLNRILWYSVRGDAPYPAHLIGRKDDE